MGGKIKIFGVIVGFFFLVVLLGFGLVVVYIFNVVFVGIFIVVGIGIIDYKGFWYLWSVFCFDVFIMVFVLLLMVFVDLLVVVVVGMILAVLFFMKKIVDVVEYKMNFVFLYVFVFEVFWNDEVFYIGKLGDLVYIRYFDGLIFFGFVDCF